VISLVRRIAGRSRAKSRPRCGKRRGLTSALLRAASISNACLKPRSPARAKFRPHLPWPALPQCL